MSTRARCVVLAMVMVLSSTGRVAASTAGEEAARQIEFARADYAAGAFERAVAACTSALRLDPSQVEAFRIKGFALEQLHRRSEALAMLRAFEVLRDGLPPDPGVVAAIERLESAIRRGDARAGPLLLVLGGSVATGGIAVSLFALGRNRAQTEHGFYWGSRDGYDRERAAHIGGLIVGGAGLSIAASGLVATLSGRSKPKTATLAWGLRVRVGRGEWSLGVGGAW